MGKIYTAMGLMSGTSLDGVDVSIIQSDGNREFSSIFDRYFQYNNQLVQKILNLREKITSSLELSKHYNEIKDLEREITLFHVQAIKETLENSKSLVDLIGFHGQTIHHDPFNKISIQLGNPYSLANELKKNVIFSFRSLDIESGGEGAPISPIYHKFLIEKFRFKLPSCFINIGGILNLTYWDGQELIGFDLGPGNCLMDEYITSVSNIFFDKDGIIASKGKIDQNFVSNFFNNSFFKLKPPKSLDKNYFNDYLSDIKKKNYSKEDTLATLLELTKCSIIDSLKFLPKKINSLYLCGGGSKNKFLVDQIQNEFDNILINKNFHDLDPNFIEAEMIAYLSARSFYNLPITFPNTTGVKVPLCGGKLIEPRHKKPT